jgi:hypothetical protein
MMSVMSDAATGYMRLSEGREAKTVAERLTAIGMEKDGMLNRWCLWVVDGDKGWLLWTWKHA